MSRAEAQGRREKAETAKGMAPEVGLAETLGFHMSYERGRGNYAKGSTVDELYGEILAKRKRKTVNA